MYRGAAAACLSSRRRYSTVSGTAAGRRVAGVGGVTTHCFPCKEGHRFLRPLALGAARGTRQLAFEDTQSSGVAQESGMHPMEPSSARLVFAEIYDLLVST